MKKLTLLLLLLCASVSAQDQKISDLTSGSPVQATDMIPIARGGANFRLAGSDFLLAAGGATGCTTPAFSFTADTNAGVCLSAANVVWLQSDPSATANAAFLLADSGGSSGAGHYNAAGTTYSMIGATAGSTIFGYLDSVQYLLLGTTGLTIGYFTTQDQLKLAPVALGAGSFTGTITSADLTGAHTWTLPNATGLVSLEPSTTGLYALTVAGAAPTARTITSGDGSIVVSNGGGVAGNPDISVDNSVFGRYASGTGDVPATGAVGTFYYETDVNDVYTYPSTDTETWLLSLPAATGVSGGIPYFSNATDGLASSLALTANLPVIGGGAGTAPAVGTRSGNTTAFVTTTGTQTSGDCVKIDANGNHIANGSACGGGAPAFDPTVVELLEEFGSGNVTDGGIGQTGMTFAALSTGTLSAPSSVASHPGLIRLLSHATNDNSGIWVYFKSNSGADFLPSMESNEFLLDALVMVGSNSTAITSTSIVVGLANAQDPANASHAAWIRRDTDLSDTAFVFQICDASGAAGCNSAGDNTDTNTVLSTITPSAGSWYRFRIRRVAVGVGGNPTWYFRVNDETEKTFCSSGCDDTLTNVPTATQGRFITAYLTRTTTGVLSADVDYMYLKVTGLTRY